MLFMNVQKQDETVHIYVQILRGRGNVSLLYYSKQAFIMPAIFR
jgi:hypothetical protein